jgi:2-dehydro-3-deoxygluconokinase
VAAVRDVVTVGETMALLSALDASVASGSSYHLSFGGAESNVAIGLARLGFKVAWVSALGTDSFGDMIHREISAEGVEVIAHRNPLRPTGLMVKNLSVGEDRLVSYYRSGSAASALNVSDLSEDLIGSARVLHLTGITPSLSTETRELTLDAARRAQALGVIVSLDLNYRPALWSEAMASAVLREVVTVSDIVFGSPDELALIVGQKATHEQLARGVGEFGPGRIVVKDGARGAGLLADGEWSSLPAHRVDVVDTVGAGDGFVAGFLSELLAGSGSAAQLHTAVITGALCCTHPGDWQGFPSRQRLDEFREAATK